MKTQRETPEWLANKMTKLIMNNPHINAGFRELFLLEPSAGTGALVDAVLTLDLIQQRNITCVELNEEKCEVLKSKNYNTIRADFLAHQFESKFDAIIAAPPFKNNIDVAHIAKMYALLNEHGTLVSLTSPYWLVNNEIHQVEFRNFLKDKKHTLEMLPDMTFVEKGKTVPTAILTIRK